jgi:hypothetical protein
LYRNGVRLDPEPLMVGRPARNAATARASNRTVAAPSRTVASATTPAPARR